MTDADFPMWFCERCAGRIRDDGRLTILPSEIPEPPDELRWHILHDRCMVADDPPSPIVIVASDIDTWKKVARWGAHFLDKAWFPRSDWWRVVQVAGAHGPLGLGDIDVTRP